ncbi:glycosyltransferase family A protein [Xenorhabdus sp. KJ12.1]|uniref:glycosyltransferase family A protein n=1 Tax=Xenorhabdus sp. KJ12.1 TaxID=1851571 RepID=UPI000C049B1D|nr:glycosyltransferase family 2 protein [Xenorhabdus sp. KJ12.1]PHM68338.1 beta-1,3-glucosyltransferase [Xenorhabdus sp. KJ12.1]
MKLDMLYSTHDDGIYSLLEKVPEYHPRTNIIIIHQIINEKNYDDISYKLENRNDIDYYKLKSKGVTKSRNLAIKKSKNDIILFCDDDTSYKDGFQDFILRQYETNEDIDFITFSYSQKNKILPKFSKIKFKHNIKTILSVGTIEITCKSNILKEKKLFFPEDMGAGEKYFLCDEPVFLSRLLKDKLKGIYIPYIICEHPDESSGSIFNHRNAYASRLLCFIRIFGFSLGRILYLFFIIKNINKFNSLKNFNLAISVFFSNLR